jgi:hypothetical protein
MRWLAATVGLAALACGGSTAGGGVDASVADGAAATDAAAADGARDDGGDACPPGTPSIPPAAIYACDAGAAPGSGCRAAPGDPNAANDPRVFPPGCVVTLPTAATGFCTGACCGPLTCNCETIPGMGAQFVCPL